MTSDRCGLIVRACEGLRSRFCRARSKGDCELMGYRLHWSVSDQSKVPCVVWSRDTVILVPAVGFEHPVLLSTQKGPMCHSVVVSRCSYKGVKISQPETCVVRCSDTVVVVPAVLVVKTQSKQSTAYKPYTNKHCVRA